MTVWILCLIPLAFTGFFVLHAPSLHAVSIPWAESLGIRLSFLLDGWGLLLATLISSIGFFIVLYSGSYLKGHAQLGRFYFYLIAFMLSMLGVVLCDNMIALFVFWELTSLTSYFLIGFDHESSASRASALQALLVTGAGGLCLLAGLVLIGSAAGTYEISEALKKGPEIAAHGHATWALALLLAGAFTKSAQFPFHFWLPNAMSAPTPVSAYLHSSTMVKAGVYLLGRFLPLFGQSPLWKIALCAAGLLTVITGVRMSFLEKDMKRQLAYLTVTALGILVALLGIGSPAAVQAAVTFLLAHALYKGALFMVVGCVDHAAHTRDAGELGGLRRRMPVTAASALLAGLSMAAVPPLLGFIAKEAVLESMLHSPLAWVFLACLVAAGSAFVYYFLLLCVKPFHGAVTAKAAHAREADFGCWAGPAVLAAGSLLAGIFPSLVVPALQRAAGSIDPSAASFKLSLWHGLNPAFLIGVSTLASGGALYWKRDLLLRVLGDGRAFLERTGPETFYAKSLASLNSAAVALTSTLQSGYLRRYLKITILAAVAACAVPLASVEWPVMRLETPGFIECALSVLVIAASIAAAAAQGRLTAVAYMGVVGLSVMLLFLLYSAPDLAMTQFTADMLTVILLALALYRMPSSKDRAPERVSASDLFVSISGGLVMFFFTLLVASREPSLSATARYFSEHSLTHAHGHNIVNVILVDFRGLDTMGEMTVLIVSGLGAYSLLRLVLPSKEKRG